MTSPKPALSPRRASILAGWLYVYIIGCGIFAEVFVRDKLIDYNDATVTAKNIVASEGLFRIGFASELLLLVCDTAVTLILYVLLRPVNRTMALLSAFFRLVSIAIAALNKLHYFGALLFLGGAQYLTVFQTEQRQALALLSLKLHAYGYDISLVFFGFHLSVLGYLSIRSGGLPKIIGILLVVAGLCYLTNSFTRALAPALATTLFPLILAPAFIAELSLTLWLLFKGINARHNQKPAT